MIITTHHDMHLGRIYLSADGDILWKTPEGHISHLTPGTEDTWTFEPADCMCFPVTPVALDQWESPITAFSEMISGTFYFDSVSDRVMWRSGTGVVALTSTGELVPTVPTSVCLFPYEAV